MLRSSQSAAPKTLWLLRLNGNPEGTNDGQLTRQSLAMRRSLPDDPQARVQGHPRAGAGHVQAIRDHLLADPEVLGRDGY